jgi:LCP family protein required for cell wall assembly
MPTRCATRRLSGVVAYPREAMSSVTETFPEIPSIPPAPPGEPPKKRMGWAKKGFLFLLAMLVLGVFAGYGYLTYTEGKIDRIAPSELTALAPVTGGSGDPINFLIVGVDDRSTLPDDWEDSFGDFAGRRTDVIMVAHIVPGEGIQILSIPRDLKSSIRGFGTNRINAAYVLGGPDLLVETVQSETGIPINHYAEIDFAGVGAVVDSLGGVTLDFDYPGRDLKSGFEIDAGTRTLNGEQAVAYARSRTYQILKDGEWQSTGGGDISRTSRQQEVLIALFDQATSPRSAFNLPTFLPTFADQITADEGVSIALMATLGKEALSMNTRDIDNMTLPVKNFRGDDGRAYVVSIDTTQSVINAFVAGLPFPR